MLEEQKTAESFDAWAIVEILGHKVVAGRVTEQVIAGQGFVRVDVPEVSGQVGFTQIFGPGSIYAITPTTEEIARRFVERSVSPPIQPWQLALPAGAQAPADWDDVDDSELDDYDGFADDDEPL